MPPEDRFCGAGGRGDDDAGFVLLNRFMMPPPLPSFGRSTCVEIKILRRVAAFVQNRRNVPHAIDATPARWCGGACSSPLDRARTAAPSPRNDIVKCTDALVDFHTEVDEVADADAERLDLVRRLQFLCIAPKQAHGAVVHDGRRADPAYR